MADHECVCGALFPRADQLTAHALTVYPPHADAPLDGAYHAPAGDGAPVPAATLGEYTAVCRLASGLLGYRQHLPERLAADLETLTTALAVRVGGLECAMWAFDPRRYLRVAAAITHRICTGELKPGDRVVKKEITGHYQVSNTTASSAIRKLLESRQLIRVTRSTVKVADPDTEP